MGRIAVIGGGAAGMMAAVAAAGEGADVTLFERNDRVGKKMLATGNGKCNFSNRDFSVQYYYGCHDRLEKYFSRFSMEDAVAFFEAAGMLVKDRQGYLYPRSEQASTVLDILRLEMKRLGVETVLSTEIREIGRNKERGSFAIHSAGDFGEYDAVILACGGRAAPKTGSDGSGYVLAERLGHNIVPAVPALVQLRCSDDFFKMAAGVRCEAGLSLYAEEGVRDGRRCRRLLQKEQGELQITDYGISGIPVFQLSRTAAYALKEKKQVQVMVDFLPGIKDEDFEELCALRIRQAQGRTMEEFLLGLANKKINLLMLRQAGRKPQESAAAAGSKALRRLLYSYRQLVVHVSAPNSFDQAQVTAGGVALSEVTEELESLRASGVYFAGEILDVDGRCGGYNLQWAWTSGQIAGRSAAKKVREGVVV